MAVAIVQACAQSSQLFFFHSQKGIMFYVLISNLHNG